MSQFTCEICNYKTDKKGNYNRHLTTKKHKKRLEKETDGIFKCSLCDYVTMRRNNYLETSWSAIHINSLKDERNKYINGGQYKNK